MNVPAEFAPWLGVFETVRVIEGKPMFYLEHWAEMMRGLETLGLASGLDLDAEVANLPPQSGRWRWVVTPGESWTRFTEESYVQKPVSLSVSPVRVGSNNWDARFKTISHLAYAQAWKTAVTSEVIMLNERGHVASASRGNIFWRRGDTLYTPAHEAGCRRGVVRGFALSVFEVQEGHFPVAELLEADEIFITNSMKGVVTVNEIQGRQLKAFVMADLLREKYDKAIVEQLESQSPA